MPPRRKQPSASLEVRDLHLIYRIDQMPNDVDVMLLGRTLIALGTVVSESVRLLETAERELVVSVRPFEEGSFVMDVVLEMKRAADMLLVLGQSEFITQVRNALEVLGIVRKVKDEGSSLLNLVRTLKGKKPKQVAKKKDRFEYESQEGEKITVSPAVNTLYNNGVIHQHFYSALGAPFESGRTVGIETYLKGNKSSSLVRIDSTEVSSLKSYSEPSESVIKERTIRNELIQLLRPKSGNYGEHQGLWTFTIAGSKRTLRAKITDEHFLKSYTRGSVRFFQGDKLEAKLIETQSIRGDDVSVAYEIIQVLDYQPAPLNPSPAITTSVKRKRKTKDSSTER